MTDNPWLQDAPRPGPAAPVQEPGDPVDLSPTNPWLPAPVVARAPARTGRRPSTVPAPVSPVAPGYRIRTKPGPAACGWYAPLQEPAPTTTRQAEILNTAVIAAPTDDIGLLIGQDLLSHAPVAHDPFTAYQRGQITSPNCTVVGNVGSGKSSLLKTCYVLRPLILRNRRVVVLDKKPRGDEGEYAEVTRMFGSEPIRMQLGEGGTVLNPLDPLILAGTGVSGQFALLAAMAEEAQQGVPLTKWEMGALRAAHTSVLRQAEDTGRDPLLPDLVTRLGADHPEFATMPRSARDTVAEAGVGLRFLIEGLLEELAGLFDGPTSPGVRLGGALTCFDISQLPETGPSIRMVMAVIQQWLLGTLRHDRGNWLTNLVVEEGWHLVGGPGGRLLQANVKLSRALGLSTVAAIHQPGDIPPDSPAIALLKESQTVHVYRQSTDEDVEACRRLFGLSAGSCAALRTLPQGQHFLRIGNRREVRVLHRRSPLEIQLTNTDAAMGPAQ